MNAKLLRRFSALADGRLTLTTSSRYLSGFAVAPARSYSTKLHSLVSPTSPSPLPLLRAVTLPRARALGSGILFPQRASLRSIARLQNNSSNDSKNSSQDKEEGNETNDTSKKERAKWYRPGWEDSPNIITYMIIVSSVLVFFREDWTEPAVLKFDPFLGYRDTPLAKGDFVRDHLTLTLDNWKEGRWWLLVPNAFCHHGTWFPLHAFWLMRWGTPVVAILGSQIRFVAFWVTTSTLAAAGGLLCQSYLDKTRPSRIGRDDGVVRGFTPALFAMVGFLTVMSPKILLSSGYPTLPASPRQILALILLNFEVAHCLPRQRPPGTEGVIAVNLDTYTRICAAGTGVLWGLITIRRNPGALKKAAERLRALERRGVVWRWVTP